MKGIPIADLALWLSAGGHLSQEPCLIGAPTATDVAGVCVDGRLARPGCMFVALPGARTDGHSYVDQAVQRGAVAALIASDRLESVRRAVFGSVRLFAVDDPLSALQTLGHCWRGRFGDLLRIGVTGSNGKTTTKEMLGSILSLHAPTVRSRGNYNSDIGLPMELLRIRPEHRYGVFEMGMNRPGEIRLLAELLEPQMVLVTNIGTAHIGMIGSREGIAREKAEAFSLFTGSETAVIPESGPCSELLAASVRGRVIRHGLGAAGVIAVRLSGIDGSVLDLGEGAVRLAPPGQAMADCAVAAITVARLIGVPFAVIRDGLEACPASFGRSEVIRGVVTVIQDCYNANPESTGAALQTIQGVRHEGRRIAVLGAMKELGAETDAAHRAVADIGLHSGLDEVWFVGDEYASAVAGRVSGPGTTARYFATDEWERVVQAASRVEPGALVLLKGSRAIALERLTPVLLRHEVDG